VQAHCSAADAALQEACEKDGVTRERVISALLGW
jgi:hypothetical protein